MPNCFTNLRHVQFVVIALLAVISCESAFAQRQMETLGRGVVALRRSTTQVHVGWRMLGTDPDNIGFNVYRSSNGGLPVKLNLQAVTNTTDYVDTPPSLAVPNAYHVRPVINGVEQAPSGTFTVPANATVPTDFQNNVAPYLTIPLQIPPGGTTPDGTNYTYSANDCSIGDLDGDGEYEIIVKWDPSNSKDNSQSGYTGNVFLDAYKLDGTRLWRINLGINIRAGAHYTQFMVYDLDGDGRAEVACKTAPGTVDGLGNFVVMLGDNPLADYRNSSGYILSGPEYLTIFSGLTGAALATTNYIPPRGNVSSWGDSYGNRVDRFLACVAYLDGVRPSLVMCRGYYTRAVLAAWDWRNGQLTQRWVFDSNTSGNGGYAGQGNHNLSVGDVDGDGKDEITYGACAIDDNGTGLYTTGFGHGDAMHLSDMDPDRAGLEVWDVHETPTIAGAGEFRDARTGQLIWGLPSSGDTGRGLAAQIDSRFRGFQMWSSASGGTYTVAGSRFSTSVPSINFVVWWDADLQRELLDSAGGNGANTKLDKWTGNGVTRILSPYSVGEGARNNNGTKANPCLSGDLLGDWREEMLLRSADSSRLMLFVSVSQATNRFRTFLHDSQYRLSLAWQNVAYNQPPHTSFYVGPGMTPPAPPLISSADLVWVGSNVQDNVWNIANNQNWRTNGVWTNLVRTVFQQGQTVLFDMSGSNASPVVLSGTLQPGAVKVHAPVDYTFSGAGSLAGAMSLTKAGTGSLTVQNTNSYSGSTVVWEGSLLVNGSLSQSPVTVKKSVWLDSQIGGSGVLGGGLVLEPGSAIAPGANTNAPGVLTISNSLTQLGEVRNVFQLSDDPSGVAKTNDRVRVFGNLVASGTNLIEITALDGWLSQGVYPLIEYTGAFSGTLANFRLAGPYASVGILTNPPGQIALVVPSDSIVQLVWKGDGSANEWNIGATANWFDTSASASVFHNGNAVLFNDVGSNNVAVSLAGALQPAAVRVNASKNYTFGGSGSINGTAALSKGGTGTVTLTTTNLFSGGTTISNGTVALFGPAPGGYTANSFALGSGAVTFRGGTLQLYGHNLSDNVNSFGSLTNELVIPAGQSGTVLSGPRYTFASRVTGSGTLNLVVDYVRGDVNGDWTGFAGKLNVFRHASGTDDFRVLTAAGFPNARVHLDSNVFMYSRAAAGSIIPIGEFSAASGSTVSAGFGSSLGTQNAVTWRVGGLGTDATNAALIQGTTSLIKEGTGRWILSGNNTYSGSTVVNAGALLINGNQSSAGGAVSVAPAGALGGTGIVGGAATVNGLLSPGVSVGTLTFNSNLSLSSAATALFEVSKVPFTNDVARVLGGVTYGGTLSVLNVSPDSLEAGDNFRLFEAATYSGSFSAFNVPELEPGLSWNFRRLAVDGRVWVVSTNSPAVVTAGVTAGNFIASGNGGTPGWPYYVLTSTNIALPANQWTRIATNVFQPDGSFTISAPVDPGVPGRFYSLQVSPE